MQFVTFCVWLLSLGTMFQDSPGLQDPSLAPSYLVSQASVGGLFACFYLVVIVNAIDMDVLVFPCPDVFWILFLIPSGMHVCQCFEAAVSGDVWRSLVVVVLEGSRNASVWESTVWFLYTKCNSRKVSLRLMWRKHHLELAYPCGKSDQ